MCDLLFGMGNGTLDIDDGGGTWNVGHGTMTKDIEMNMGQISRNKTKYLFWLSSTQLI